MDTENHLTASLTFAPVSSPTELGLFSQLLDRAFAIPDGRHYLDDFPVWDPARGPAVDQNRPDGLGLLRLGAFTQTGQLAAAAGIRLARLHTQPGRPLLLAGLVGAVVTEPEFRGQGLASQLVEQAVGWARARGALAVFLWGSEHSLYQRLGFELCGTQNLVPLSQLNLGKPRAVHTGWNPGLFELRREKRDGLVLEVSDQSWFSAHRGVDWFWTGDPERPEAFAAMNRGIDLAGIVHEWGGETGALHAVLAAIQRVRPDAAILGNPTGLRTQRLVVAGKPGFPGVSSDFLTLARILDPVAIFELYHPHTPIQARRENGRFHLRIAAQAEFALTERELGRFLFGPVTLNPGNPGFSSGLLSRLLPLPLWFWGLDAV